MADNAILVVDDDDEICRLYTVIFEAAGLPTRCVTTRAAAVATDYPRPACVVLDWELPDGSGLEVARALRRRWGATLPIILVTGASLPTEQVRAVDVLGFLPKPFETNEIIHLVRQAMSAARPRPSGTSSRWQSRSRAG